MLELELKYLYHFCSVRTIHLFIDVDRMSGRMNPVLREALKAAKKKELQRKRKAGESVALGESGGGQVVHKSGGRWDEDGKVLEAELQSGASRGFETRMAEKAHEEIEAFKRAMKETVSDQGDGKKARIVEEAEVPKDEPCAEDVLDLESDEEEVLEQQQHVEPHKECLVAAPAPGPLPARDNEYNNEALAYPEVSYSTEEDDGNVGDGVPETLSHAQPFKRGVSMMRECRSVDRYEKLNRISEGTYGVVYRGKDKETGTICALKRLKLEKEKSGFPLTSVREINVLLALEHPNIVNVSEVVMGRRHEDPRDDQIFLVMEYADHDLSTVMRDRMKKPFSMAEIKCLMLQLLAGVAYLHENWVMHRDLKTTNILYTNKGQLKICDFGLARQFSSFSKEYTQMVVTLWYRAPELLLGTKTYSTAVDMWSVGCIMGELLLKKPILTGRTEVQQLQQIFDVIGYPNGDDLLKYKSYPLWNKMKVSRCKDTGKQLAHALRSRFESDWRASADVSDMADFCVEESQGLDLLRRLLELDPVCCFIPI